MLHRKTLPALALLLAFTVSGSCFAMEQEESRAQRYEKFHRALQDINNIGPRGRESHFYIDLGQPPCTPDAVEKARETCLDSLKKIDLTRREAELMHLGIANSSAPRDQKFGRIKKDIDAASNSTKIFAFFTAMSTWLGFAMNSMSLLPSEVACKVACIYGVGLAMLGWSCLEEYQWIKKLREEERAFNRVTQIQLDVLCKARVEGD